MLAVYMNTVATILGATHNILNLISVNVTTCNSILISIKGATHI